MIAGMVTMIGKETTNGRLSLATNQPICAQAQIAPERKAGTTTGQNSIADRGMQAGVQVKTAKY